MHAHGSATLALIYTYVGVHQICVILLSVVYIYIRHIQAYTVPHVDERRAAEDIGSRVL